MCNFLSAIYTATDKLICEPVYTDSHSELLNYAGIKERETTAPVQQFVRLELTPPEDTSKWTDLTTWTEKVDEHETPRWFDKAAQFSAFEEMRSIISSALCEGCDRLQFGRFLILTKGNVVSKGCKIIALNNSTVKALNNSTVKAWDNSTVEAWDNSTVEAWGNSTVKACGNSTVEACGNSTVKAWDNSTVIDNRLK